MQQIICVLGGLSILESRARAIFRWGELLAGDRSSWGTLESSFSGGRSGGETLLHSATIFVSIWYIKSSESKLTMKGRRTNTGCDSWTLPVGTLGDPRTPESEANVGRMQGTKRSVQEMVNRKSHCWWRWLNSPPVWPTPAFQERQGQVGCQTLKWKC